MLAFTKSNSKRQNPKLSWKQLSTSPGTAFFSLGLLFGILFLLTVPPFQVPDEPAHFFRAYQISQGKIIAEKRDNTTGGLIPLSLWNSYIIWSEIPFHPERQATKEQFFESFNTPLRRKEELFASFPNTALYSPISYLPQAVGINIGKSFNLPPIFLIYLGRITNLIVSLYLTFLAIRIAPVFKWVLFSLALTPMAVFQRASLSADSLINSISFLLIATIIKYAFDVDKRKLLKLDIAVLCLLSVLLSLSKQSYFLIPFLFFLIPRDKISNKKHYLIACLFITLSSLLPWAVWSLVVKGIYVPLRPDLPTVGEQAHFLLSHPVKFAKIAFKDFNLNLEGYLQQFIGVLGWLDAQLPDIVQISYPPMLAFIALVDSRSNVIIKLVDKLKIFAILSTSIFIVYLLMYLSWNQLGAEVIEGIQGRYFIPLAPLLLLLFYNRRISIDMHRKTLGLVVVCYSLFAQITSLFVIIHRYYK